MSKLEYSLSGDSRLPLYQRLADSIKNSIIEQQWRPGDRLPGEKELASSYNVATGTLRQAISQLIDEKLLERRHGSGTYVRRPTFDKSLFRFFRFETKDGERQIPESRIIRREVISAPSEISKVLGLEPDVPVISMTRMRLFDSKPVLIEDIWLENSRFEGFSTLDEAVIGPLLYPVYDTHFGQFICRAKESLTVEAVDASYAKMLRIKPQSPVIVIERTASGFDGKPIEWRRSRGLADHFSYNIEIQ